MEQVSSFTYLGTHNVYSYVKGTMNKISTLQMICGANSRALKTEVRKDMKLKFHKTILKLAVMYKEKRELKSDRQAYS